MKSESAKCQRMASYIRLAQDQKTRHYDHPKEFLRDFSGVLVTDGYESYHKLTKERHGEITVAMGRIVTGRMPEEMLIEPTI